MKVLFCLGPAYGGIPGGHKVQADRTIEGLRHLGVDIVTCSDTEPPPADVDLVHSMGADAAWVRRARNARMPVAASTIYWSRRYILGAQDGANRPQRLARALRVAGSAVRRGTSDTLMRVTEPVMATARAFESADLLLPNSYAEAETIRAELHVSTPMHVVPNGVDPDTFVMPHTRRQRRGVLYVGRVEPHKNQLGLIRALKGSGIPLKIVGPHHPHHPEYLRACYSAADASTEFIPERDQGALLELYQAAAVHAMPSWFETTGLSSLEACLCGAAVVTTERGYVREYFSGLVTYCDPAKPGSIRAAVAEALARGGSAALRVRVLENYTWAHTARATLAGYERLLAGRS